MVHDTRSVSSYEKCNSIKIYLIVENWIHYITTYLISFSLRPLSSRPWAPSVVCFCCQSEVLHPSYNCNYTSEAYIYWIFHVRCQSFPDVQQLDRGAAPSPCVFHYLTDDCLHLGVQTGVPQGSDDTPHSRMPYCFSNFHQSGVIVAS